MKSAHCGLKTVLNFPLIFFFCFCREELFLENTMFAHTQSLCEEIAHRIICIHISLLVAPLAMVYPGYRMLV